MWILNNNRAVATVGGVLLGFGTLAFVVLGGVACGMSLDSTCGGVVVYSALGIMCLGLFAVATSTERTLAAVVGFNMAIILFISVDAYLIITGRVDSRG